MKKFMYINDVRDGQVLVNIDRIVWVARNPCTIRTTDGATFIVKHRELEDIMTELERR